MREPRHHASSTLVIALVVVLSLGCDKLGAKKSATENAAPAATPAAGAPTAAPAPDSMKVDKVKAEGGPIGTDGHNDGAIALTVDGPVAGIVLLTVDKSGQPENGQQWDTYVEGQDIPKAIKGAPFTTGEPTWQLGVYENGKLQNVANGSLKPLSAGKHVLTLYAADSGYFNKDQPFAIYVERPDHSVVRSNVFTF